jgi:hypothetical protein
MMRFMRLFYLNWLAVQNSSPVFTIGRFSLCLSEWLADRGLCLYGEQTRTSKSRDCPTA